MKKTTKSHLVEGVLVGAALGVAAGLLFAPKAGKKIRGDIRNRAADFYKHISPQLKKLKNMTGAQYKAFMKTAVKAYAKAKKLSGKEAADLSKYAQQFWKHFVKHF